MPRLELPLIDVERPGQTLIPVDGGKIDASYGPPQLDVEADPYGISRLSAALYLTNQLLENKVPHDESRW